jgi:hypothetical protein
MNPINQRLAIYVSIALLTTVSGDLAEVANFSDLSAMAGFKIGLRAIVAGLLTWRAYIDQSATKYATQAGDQSPAAK